jgi:hypothetical protein
LRVHAATLRLTSNKLPRCRAVVSQRLLTDMVNPPFRFQLQQARHPHRLSPPSRPVHPKPQDLTPSWAAPESCVLRHRQQKLEFSGGSKRNGARPKTRPVPLKQEEKHSAPAPDCAARTIEDRRTQTVVVNQEKTPFFQKALSG